MKSTSPGYTNWNFMGKLIDFPNLYGTRFNCYIPHDGVRNRFWIVDGYKVKWPNNGKNGHGEQKSSLNRNKSGNYC